MDINDSSELAEKSTALSSSVEHSINGFIYHNGECIENNLLKLMKEINAPNYAFKKIINWAKLLYITMVNT